MVAAGVDGMGVVSIPRRAGVVRSMRAPTGAARRAARELLSRPSMPIAAGGGADEEVYKTRNQVRLAGPLAVLQCSVCLYCLTLTLCCVLTSADVLTPHAIYPYSHQTKKAPKMTMKKKSTAKILSIRPRLEERLRQ